MTERRYFGPAILTKGTAPLSAAEYLKDFVQ